MYRAIFAVAFALFVLAMSVPLAMDAYKVASSRTTLIERTLQQANGEQR